MDVNNMINEMFNRVISQISFGVFNDVTTLCFGLLGISVLMFGFDIILKILGVDIAGSLAVKKKTENESETKKMPTFASETERLRGTIILGSGSGSSEINWARPDSRITENAGLIDRHGADEENGKAPAAGTSSSGWYM